MEEDIKYLRVALLRRNVHRRHRIHTISNHALLGRLRAAVNQRAAHLRVPNGRHLEEKRDAACSTIEHVCVGGNQKVRFQAVGEQRALHNVLRERMSDALGGAHCDEGAPVAPSLVNFVVGGVRRRSVRVAHRNAAVEWVGAASAWGLWAAGLFGIFRGWGCFVWGLGEAAAEAGDCPGDGQCR